MRFVNKVVVVTGASSGIGKATAEEFSKQQATLVTVGRNVANLNDTAENCKRNGAKEVLQIVAEFEKLSEIDKIVEETIGKFGRLDILVNNAGCVKAGGLESVEMEDFDWMFNVNVKSMVRITQKAMPYLVEAKGCVVNVSSLASQYQFPQTLIYSMTKSAVDQFTKTIALEYAPSGVRVNSVNPGLVKTDLARYFPVSAEEKEKYYSAAAFSHPLGRNGSTEEIAKAILFLASEDSAWTTGQCFFLDGGRSLNVAQGP